MAGAMLTINAKAQDWGELDVLIVGSGPAGLSLADKLSKSGVGVLVVESGAMKPTQSSQSLNVVTGSTKPYSNGLGSAGRRAVGGTTHIWGGITPRFRECDFKTQKNYGYGLDWPIEFGELDQYYCDAGRWLKNRDPFCSQKLISEYDEASEMLLNELEGSGLEHSMVASMSVDNIGRFRPINLAEAVSPIIVKRQNLSLLTRTAVRKLKINNNGDVLGAYCINPDGSERFIKARTVILAAGAIQNARLLLLSHSANKPNGIGNDNGNVGAYFMDHPNIQYWLEPRRDFLSPKYNKAYVHSYHLYERMKELGMGSALLRFGAFNRNWRENNRSNNYPESNGYAKTNQRFMIETLIEQEPRSFNRISLDSGNLDVFGDPLAHLRFRQTEKDHDTINYSINQLSKLTENLGLNHSKRPLVLGSHHLMGTTRMSKIEQDGVVDKNLKVFGTSNLYITGGSVFSTGGAANPTLTLTALSLRLAAHLMGKNN